MKKLFYSGLFTAFLSFNNVFASDVSGTTLSQTEREEIPGTVRSLVMPVVGNEVISKVSFEDKIISVEFNKGEQIQHNVKIMQGTSNTNIYLTTLSSNLENLSEWYEMIQNRNKLARSQYAAPTDLLYCLTIIGFADSPSLSSLTRLISPDKEKISEISPEKHDGLHPLNVEILDSKEITGASPPDSIILYDKQKSVLTGLFEMTLKTAAAFGMMLTLNALSGTVAH